MAGCPPPLRFWWRQERGWVGEGRFLERRVLSRWPCNSIRTAAYCLCSKRVVSRRILDRPPFSPIGLRSRPVPLETMGWGCRRLSPWNRVLSPPAPERSTRSGERFDSVTPDGEPAQTTTSSEPVSRRSSYQSSLTTFLGMFPAPARQPERCPITSPAIHSSHSPCDSFGPFDPLGLFDPSEPILRL